MKNFTRFLALMLAVLFAVGTISIFATDLADTADSLYADEIDTVTSLGIMDSQYGVFQPTAKVARWKFVVYAVKALTGIVDDATWNGGTNTTTFTDVNGKLGLSAVSYAVSLDLIKGRSETIFDPTTTITMAEATTIMVRALGYDYDVRYNAEQPDSWKWAYLAKAMELGVVDGLAADALDPDHPVTKEEAALIIYNTLFITRKNGSTISDKVWGGIDEYADTALTQLVVMSAKTTDTNTTSLVKSYAVHTKGYVKLNGFVDGKVDDNYTLYMKSDEFKAYTGLSAADLIEKGYIGASVDVTFVGDSIETMTLNTPTIKKGLSGTAVFDGTEVTFVDETFETAGADLYVGETAKYTAGYPVYREDGVYKMSVAGDKPYYGVDGEEVYDYVGNKFFLDEDDNIVAEWVSDINSTAYAGVIVSGQYGKFASAAETWDYTGLYDERADGNYRHATDADLAKVAIIFEENKGSKIANATDLDGVKDTVRFGSYTATVFDDDGDGIADRIFVQGTEYNKVIGRLNDGKIEILVQNADGIPGWTEYSIVSSDKLSPKVNYNGTAYASYKALAAADDADYFVAMKPADATASLEILEWIPYQYGQIVHLAEIVNPTVSYTTTATIGIKDRTTGVTTSYFVDIDPQPAAGVTSPNNTTAAWKYYYDTTIAVGVAGDVAYLEDGDGTDGKILADRSVVVSQWVRFVTVDVKATTSVKDGKAVRDDKTMIIDIEKMTKATFDDVIYISSDLSTPSAATFTVLDTGKAEIVTIENVNLVDTVFNNSALAWLYSLRTNLAIDADGNFAYNKNGAQFEGFDIHELWASANLFYLDFTKDNVGQFYTVVDDGNAVDWAKTNRAYDVTEYALLTDTVIFDDNREEAEYEGDMLISGNPYYFVAGKTYPTYVLEMLCSAENNTSGNLTYKTKFDGKYTTDKSYTFVDESAFFEKSYTVIDTLDEYTVDQTILLEAKNGDDGTNGYYQFFVNRTYCVGKTSPVTYFQHIGTQGILRQFSTDILNALKDNKGNLPSALNKTDKSFTVYRKTGDVDTIYSIDADNNLYVYTEQTATSDAALTKVGTSPLSATAKKDYTMEVSGVKATATFISHGANFANTTDIIDTKPLYAGQTFDAFEFDYALTRGIPADSFTASDWGTDAHGISVTAAEKTYAASSTKTEYRYTFTATADATGNTGFIKSTGINYDGKTFTGLMTIDGTSVGAYNDDTKFIVIEPQNITVNSNASAYTQAQGYTFTSYTAEQIAKMQISIHEYIADFDDGNGNGKTATRVILFGNIIPGDTGTVTLTECQNATVDGLELGATKSIPTGTTSYTVSYDSETYPILVVKVNGTAVTVDENGKFSFTVAKDTNYYISVIASEVPVDMGTVNVTKNADTDKVTIGDVEAKNTQDLPVGTYTITVTPKAGYPIVTVRVNREFIQISDNSFTLTVEKDKTYDVEVVCSATIRVFLNSPVNSTLTTNADGELVWTWTTAENKAIDLFSTETLSGSVYESYVWDPTEGYPEHIYDPDDAGVYTVVYDPDPTGTGTYRLIGDVWEGDTLKTQNVFTEDAEIVELLKGSEKLSTGAFYGTEALDTILFFDLLCKQDGQTTTLSYKNRTALQMINFKFVSFTTGKGFTVIDATKFEDPTKVDKVDRTAYNFLPWNSGDSYASDYWKTGANTTTAQLAAVTGTDTIDVNTVTFKYTLAADGKIIVFVNTTTEVAALSGK